METLVGFTYQFQFQTFRSIKLSVVWFNIMNKCNFIKHDRHRHLQRYRQFLFWDKSLDLSHKAALFLKNKINITKIILVTQSVSLKGSAVFSTASSLHKINWKHRSITFLRVSPTLTRDLIFFFPPQLSASSVITLNSNFKQVKANHKLLQFSQF